MNAIAPETLLQAYRLGLFPMARKRSSSKVFWVDPETRGVIPLNAFHLPRNVIKIMKNNRFSLTTNTSFENVIRACGSSVAGRAETWINDQIISVYKSMHSDGHAHSVEVWEEKHLVGGLYGLAIGGAFFGESMFSLQTNASKVALATTLIRLKSSNFSLFDVQFVTPHLARFGAIEISRHNYLSQLRSALEKKADFLRLPLNATSQRILQEIVHTS